MRFRFSGHESFHCRYTWLPKVYRALKIDPLLFADENNAMVKLGLGKNMVKSIRFWSQAFGIAAIRTEGGGYEVTPFAVNILDPEIGLDPFLEDIRTLWLLHWKLSSINNEPLFAWHFLINEWSEPTFSKSEIVSAFGKAAEQQDRPLSTFTKEQHFDIFLHTYTPTKGKKISEVLEDSLDSPFVELSFIVPAGERDEKGRRELLYEFRRDKKTEITQELFAYCIFEYWKNNRIQESTISFRDVSVVPGSLGQVFRLSEPDIRMRLETLNLGSNGLFEFQASLAVPKIIKHGDLSNYNESLLLKNIYLKSKLKPKIQKQNQTA